MSEKVLTFPEAGLFQNIKCDFENGLNFDPNKYSRGFVGFPKTTDDLLKTTDDLLKNVTFVDRELAERSPEYKQIIPYCVVFSKENPNKVFCYQRTKMAGETRLHGKWSLGVGGHINPCDGDGSGETYNISLEREIMEELGTKFEYKYEPNEIWGLIYDDSDEVGKVHVGFVHLLIVSEKDVKSEDPSISSGIWLDYADLPKDTERVFENWSKIIINYIGDRLQKIWK